MASSSTPPNPLLYSCIAYRTTILTEHSASASSQTSSLASLILPKISHDAPQKLTYNIGSNCGHYIADGPSSNSSPNAPGLTYLVIAPASTGRRIPFGYLVSLRSQFLNQYNPKTTDFQSQPPYGCASFNTTLKNLISSHGSTESGQKDAIGTAQREIDDVRGIMTENIERVLERGERLDLLIDKTDRLGGSARDFRMRSKGLRRRMWWKNTRMIILLSVVVVFLLYLVVGAGCGLPGWSHCLHKSKKSD